MSKGSKQVSCLEEWLSDSEDVESDYRTPKRKNLNHTPSDSETGTPDSPIVWNYTFLSVDQKTKDAAEKLDLGLREWKRRRRCQQDSSPNGSALKRNYYLTQLRLAALTSKNAGNQVEGDIKPICSESNTLSKDDSILENKENFLSDENDMFFLQIDLSQVSGMSNEQS